LCVWYDDCTIGLSFTSGSTGPSAMLVTFSGTPSTVVGDYLLGA
jgi:hypothetical protein